MILLWLLVDYCAALCVAMESCAKEANQRGSPNCAQAVRLLENHPLGAYRRLIQPTENTVLSLKVYNSGITNEGRTVKLDV